MVQPVARRERAVTQSTFGRSRCAAAARRVRSELWGRCRGMSRGGAREARVEQASVGRVVDEVTGVAARDADGRTDGGVCEGVFRVEDGAVRVAMAD